MSLASSSSPCSASFQLCFTISGCQSWKDVCDPQTLSLHCTDEITIARGLWEICRPHNPDMPKIGVGPGSIRGSTFQFSRGPLDLKLTLIGLLCWRWGDKWRWIGNSREFWDGEEALKGEGCWKGNAAQPEATFTSSPNVPRLWVLTILGRTAWLSHSGPGLGRQNSLGSLAIKKKKREHLSRYWGFWDRV